MTTKTRTQTWFAQLWALAILFHLAGNTGGLLDPGRLVFFVELGMAVTAAIVLFRPQRAKLLGVAGVLQLWNLWLEAPVIGNHAVILGLVNLSLVMALVLERWGGRPWLDLFAPAGRAVLLGSYGFIAFSKLNTGFFDTSESCAVVFGDEVLRWVGLTLQGQVGQSAVIWATVVAELAVPFLLWRRPRVGVPFAMTLHFVFALDPIGHVYDFSSALFPLFLLFAPAGFGAWFDQHWQKVRSRLAFLGITAAFGFTVLAAFDLRASLAGYPVWLFYGTVMLGLVMQHRRHWEHRPAGLHLHPAFGLVLVLVLVNGLSPYLELKTTFGFNMYSNLRTEAGESNHLVFVDSIPLRNTQEQLVEIIDSSDPVLRDYRDQNLGLTYQSLRVYLADHPDVSIRYQLRGAEYDLARAADDARLATAPGMLVQKFGAYRAIDLDAEKGCLRWWRPAL